MTIYKYQAITTKIEPKLSFLTSDYLNQFVQL